MKIIDSVLLDEICKQAKESPRLRMNYNLHSELDEPVQRLMNALEPGTEIPVHRHRHTDETYLVLFSRQQPALQTGSYQTADCRLHRTGQTRLLRNTPNGKSTFQSVPLQS